MWKITIWVLYRTLFFDIISSKFNALGLTFLQVRNLFSGVVFFNTLEIVVDRLDGFFIAHKFVSSQKSFEFSEQMKVWRKMLDRVNRLDAKTVHNAVRSVFLNI